MISKPLFSIIVVNWNAGKHLDNLFGSIVLYHDDLISKVIVVDNKSDDGSLDIVNSYTDCSFSTEIIINNINKGFASACNQGAALASEGSYLLFLNPDSKLLPNTLRRVYEYMENSENSNVGICGVQLFNEEGVISRSCASFPAAAVLVAQSIGLDRMFPSLSHFMTEWTHESTRFVDQVIGAFFVVRQNVFEQLGGFDERFFVYFEELDFSLRSHQAGWKTVYLAEAQAFHAGGGTSNQVKARRLFYSLRSRLLYSFKHFSFIGAMAVLLVTLLLEPLSRSALALGRRSFTTFHETWSGYGMLWRWLPQWIFKGVTR